MKTVKNLLDEIKAKTGLASDYALAKTLDLPTQRISDYYKGTRTPDEFACLKIAEALGTHLETIIATVKATSEKDEKRREVWENYMKRLGGIAAGFASVFLSLVISIVTSGNAEASPIKGFASLAISNVLYYVKSKLKLQVKAILRRVSQKCLFCMNIAGIRQIAA